MNYDELGPARLALLEKVVEAASKYCKDKDLEFTLLKEYIRAYDAPRVGEKVAT